MTISPYLESLLYQWGRSVRWRPSAWYTTSPYMQEWIGKTTRAPMFSDDGDEVDQVGGYIAGMSDPLQKALKARFAYPFKTDRHRAKWCRMTQDDYKSYLNEAVRKLETWVNAAA